LILLLLLLMMMMLLLQITAGEVLQSK